MEDEKIIALYFSRSEQAIQETDRKYGGYCHSIAMNILTDHEDAEECVSDTYMAAWNTIPPKKPAMLNAFLGRITRYISIDRWRKRSSVKRGGGEIILALEELEDCASQSDTIETVVEKKQAASASPTTPYKCNRHLSLRWRLLYCFMCPRLKSGVFSADLPRRFWIITFFRCCSGERVVQH